ncbi:MAG: TonB-dependent siderophore receptor [Nostoc sp. S4]|nr:TonB-dependent siderophore receptor [Nostoc sp. S4]
MKSWQSNLSLCLAASVVGIISTLLTQAAWAEVKLDNKSKLSQKGIDNLPQQIDTFNLGDRLTKWGYLKIRQLGDLETPIASAQQLLVQSPTPQTIPALTIPITSVKANATSKGVEVILETPVGTQLQVTNRSTGNNFIVDVSGGQLRLPSGDAFTFRSEKPLAGITEITVTNIDANTVRVMVVGEKALPTVELFDDDAGLVFGIATTATAQQPPQTPQTQTPAPRTPQQQPPDSQQDEPIELVVTGEQDSYRVQDATTATRTDTPLRDIPQSIQVVPQQVIKDRSARDLREAVQTVSGVVKNFDYYSSSTASFLIRGFDQQGNFRNGFRDVDFTGLTGIGTIERVEVLKGPASVLFGSVEPGGIVNVVTKQPLSKPYYQIGFEAGSYGFYQPSIDLSGPLNTEKNLLYRFIVNYQSQDSYQDFANSYLLTIAPSITWKIGDRTDLNLYYEYNKYFGNPPQNPTTYFSDGRKLPRDIYLGYPDFSFVEIVQQRFGYEFKHQFSDNWQIRNSLSVAANRVIDESNVFISELVDDRFIEIGGEDRDFTTDNYFGQLDLLGKFNTGSISHQVLLGFDANRNVLTYKSSSVTGYPILDILNPNYNVTKPEPVPFSNNNSYTQSYGIYFQDQIALQNNLKLLVGGRYDWVSSKGIDNVTGDTTENPENSAFSPRIGLVYQPIQEVSLYTSYSRSFVPNNSANPDGQTFVPTRGTQYEVGIKTDLLENRLSATLAAYQITKSDVLTDDPDPVRADQGYQIQVGEQRSRGIELDIGGEILPGWKVTGSYAYTDAEITEDNVLPVGNKLSNVPYNQASLWTNYEIQNGNLKGLGFGLGLFYVGERPVNLDNTSTVGDYLRTDAAIFYRRDGFNASINIRNLFDNDYVAQSDGFYVNRGEPLTLIGSISWEF